nr:hypothetical protein CFP56_75415 [Quercus suber]
MLQRWKKGMNVGNIKWTYASLWVQIWGAPFDMASPQVAQKVGNRLGVVEDMERRRKQDDQNFFMLDLHHCALHFARKKNGDGVDYQYGEWLKSEGGRAKSPPKRSANLRRGSDADVEDVLG